MRVRLTSRILVVTCVAALSIAFPVSAYATPSANDATVTTAGQTLTDAAGNVWTFTAGGVVDENGAPASFSANAVEMAYVNGIIYHKNTSGQWWKWMGSTWMGPVANPLPFTPSASGSTVTVAGQTLTDSNGNVWTFNTAAKVTVNGMLASVSGNVVEMAYVNGTIYHENTSGQWWKWTGSTWTGSVADPLPFTPSASGSTVTVAGQTLTDSNGNVWTFNTAAKVTENGLLASISGNVVEVAYVNGTIYHKNTSGQWWKWIGTTWTGPVANPLPVTLASCTDSSGTSHASGSSYTLTLSTTAGTTTATTQQCPYGGTQPTTTTVTQVQLCTNGTLTNQGNQVTTTVNTGTPTCNAAPGTCQVQEPNYNTLAISASATSFFNSFSDTTATATLPELGFLDTITPNINTSASSTPATLTTDRTLTSPRDANGFSLDVTTTNALANNWYFFAGDEIGSPAGYDSIGFDVYIPEDATNTSASNVSFVVLLEDGINNRLVTPAVQVGSSTNAWTHYSFPQSQMWDEILDSSENSVNWNNIRNVGFQFSCNGGSCASDIRLDGLELENSTTGASSPLWTSLDESFTSLPNPTIYSGPRDGDVILSMTSPRLLFGDWQTTQTEMSNFFGGHYSVTITDNNPRTSDLLSNQQTLAAMGIPVQYYSQFSLGGYQYLANHGAYEVALNTPTQPLISPLWQPMSAIPGIDDSHVEATADPETYALYKQKADTAMSAGISSWLICDYTRPWFNGWRWGFSPSMLSSYQADLNGTDEGLYVSSTCAPIHFSDYFSAYNGFSPQPADVGISSWNTYTPPTGASDTSAQDIVWFFLESYEWLKNADRAGRHMQANDGKGVVLMPNAESVAGSSDYVFALRSEGVAGLMPEYFQNTPLASEAAYSSLSYLRSEASKVSKSLAYAFETGSGGNSAPYQQWPIAFATSYTLTAAGQANNVENDWLTATYDSESNPSSAGFANLRDALVKGDGFRLAREDSASRSSSPILVVANRPPVYGSSLFFTTQDPHSFAPSFSRADIVYDLKDQLNLDQTLNSYQFVALSPYALRVGDDQNILNWLNAQSGRVLMTDTFVPTRSTADYWVSMGLTTGGGSHQFGSEWGLGTITQTANTSATITAVDSSVASLSTLIGKTLTMNAPMTKLTGTTGTATVLVNSTAGPLVTQVKVGNSYIIYLSFSPFAIDTYTTNPEADPNLPITTAIVKALTAAYAPSAASSDTGAIMQTYNVSGGQAIVAWDRAAAEAWPGSPTVYTYSTATPTHTISVPTSLTTPYSVYDFFGNTVASVTPQNGAVTFNMSNVSTGIYYVGPASSAAFQATVSRAQSMRAQFISMGF